MRPPKEVQGAFRAPLNRMFGTEANVRLLRILSSKHQGLGVSELSRRTALSYTAVSRALEGLVDSGIVEPVRSDRGLRVQFHRAHPLAEAVVSLFAAERARRERVLMQIRQAVAMLSPSPKSVWIEGSVVSDSDEFGDPLVLGILAGSRELGSLADALRDKLEVVERVDDVTIEIRGRTIPDLEAASKEELSELRSTILIMGPAPLAFLDSPSPQRVNALQKSHQNLDARSREFAAAVADRLLKDPDIVQRAREYIEERVENASPGERKELLEWQHILDTTSIGRLRRFLLSDSARATRLRQTMPFVKVLSPEEREAIVMRESQ